MGRNRQIPLKESREENWNFQENWWSHNIWFLLG